MHLRQAWTVRLPGYSHGALAHAGNRLLTVVGGERLCCYVADGTLAWSRRVDASLIAALPTARGSVYVEASTILRVDIETGRVLAWRDVEPEYPNISVDEDLLLFPAEMPSRLFALDLETLETRLEVPTTGMGHPHHGMICESDADGDIRLRDPATGPEAWHWQLPTSVGEHSGHFHAGDLYCRMSGVERIAIDVRTGRIEWREIEGDPAMPSPPSVHSFRKLVGTTAYAGRDGLSAYDVATGALKWRIPLGSIVSSTFDGTRAAVVTEDRALHIVNLAAGAVVVRHELRRQISDVVLAGSRVFVKSFTDDRDAHELCGFELIDDDEPRTSR